MSLSTLSVKRPILAIVLNLLIILFGLIAYKNLGVREFPSIDPPIVSVRTSYPGANADIIESQITVPLEKALNGVAGIRSISSASNQGGSSITIEFGLGTDMETAANDVRDKVTSAVQSLPRDLDGLPTVSKSDANSESIIAFTISNPNKSLLEISDVAENVIGPRFQTINGVSGLQMWGLKKIAMRLWMNPAKMAALGVTTQDIKTALDRENIELPGGKLQGKTTELTLKTAGRFQNEDDFNKLIIKSEGTRNILLRDIGYASVEAENQETAMRVNGEARVGIALQPQAGSNYLDIAKEANIRFEQIKKDLPKGYELVKFFDNTLFIESSLEEVKETLLIAIGLVVVIIFFFFRDWVVAVRPLIDIPVSLIGTFFVMYMCGFTINVLTLLAIVLATGLVVDDGIVVTENIYKKIEEGLSPIQASIKGANEIMFAVLSTSITLAAVFLPVIFMDGFVGKLFREFGIVLASAVLISAFVSLSLTPMLNAYLTRKNGSRNKFYTATEPYFKALEDGYEKGLAGFMKTRIVALPIILISMGMVYYFGKNLKSELSPLDDRSFVRVNMTLPEGSTYEYTDAYVNRVRDMILDSIPEVTQMLTVTAPNFSGSGAPNTASSRVILKPKEERTATQSEIATKINGLLRKMSDGKAFGNEQQTISLNRRGGLPMQYIIQAPTFAKLTEYLPKFMDKVNQDPTFPASEVDLKFNKPEIGINIDREKAKSMGISVADIAQTIQLAFAGQRFGYFNQNGRQYAVIGQFEREQRNEPIDLTSLYVKNNQGQLVQLDNIVKATEQSSPPQLYHYNQDLSATVSAGLAPGKTLGDGIEAMERIKNEINDESIKTALTGNARDFVESSSQTLFSFLLALLLVYLILAAQFESFRDPLIIMFTVPLAIAGATFSLWFFDQTLNIFSQIGIIMLVGLVTKNGILIVEFANQLREEGLSPHEAVIKASSMRLRPILMTTLATVLGAMPIAMAIGAAGASRKSMGIVVVGGLLFSLVLTLYIIPAMYTYLTAKNKRTDKDFERELSNIDLNPQPAH
jgi:multidrug efflux pump